LWELQLLASLSEDVQNDSRQKGFLCELDDFALSVQGQLDDMILVVFVFWI